jgi:ABC-type ATPase with predicted acetyltransferase domain
MQNINTNHPRLDDVPLRDHDRSERLFTDAGLWYFRTREGKDVGPFRYRCEAESMLSRFLEEVRQAQEQAIARVKPHFRTSAIIGKRQ